MALSVKIGGVERAQDVPLRSLTVRNAVTSEVDTADLDVVSGAAPVTGQEVLIEDVPLTGVLTSQADWQACTLPPQADAVTSPGDLLLYRPTATFSRPSTAYLPDGTQVASGAPRYPTGRFGQALVIEEGRRNLFLYSDPASLAQLYFSQGAALANGGVAPFLTGGVWFGDNSTSRYAYERPTLAAGTQYCLSAYVRMDDGGTPVVTANPSGSGADMALVISNQGAAPQVLSLGGGLYRVWGTLTTASGITGAGTEWYCGVFKASSYSARTFKVSGLQIEQGAYPTSYYPTQGAAATRANESLSTSSRGMSLTQGTVEMWVCRTTAWKSYGMPIYADAGASYFHIEYNSSGSLRWYIGSSTGLITYNPTFAIGQWTHLAFRWNNGVADILENGVLKATGSYTGLTAIAPTLYIGSGPNNYWTNWLLDDVHGSTVARSNAEILAHATAATPIQADVSTLFLWRFDGNLLSEYPPQATAVTKVIDLGRAPERSGVLRLTATTPGGTSVNLQYIRSCVDGMNWGPWTAVGPGNAVPASVQLAPRYQVQFTLSTTDPMQTPVLSDLTLAFDEDGENGREFGGQITSATQTEPVPGEVRYAVRCVDWTRKGDARLVNETYTNKTRGEIARDLATKYCSGFTATAANVPNGAVIQGEYRIVSKKPSQVFRELCDATGGDWYWDPYKGLHMFDAESDAAAAPFKMSDDGATVSEHPADLSWVPDITDVATRVYVRGGDYFPAASYPQTIRCDGVARAWLLNYKPKDLTVTVGGVPQVVAVDDLINQPANADYTYNFQEKLLKRAPGKATPADGTQLVISYRPFLPVRVRVDDPAAQARLAALEGGDGIYEATIIDESIETIEQARLAGQAYLNQHADPAVTGGYTTLRKGLRAGQLQAVQMTARAINTQIVIGAVTKQRLPGGRWRSQVVFASKLMGGVVDLLVRLLRDRAKIEYRSDEVLELMQAFTSAARASDTLTVTAVAPQRGQADTSRADRCEVA